MHEHDLWMHVCALFLIYISFVPWPSLFYMIILKGMEAHLWTMIFTLTFPSSCWIWILIHRIPMANKEEEYRRRTAPIDNKFHLSMAVASRQNLNQYIKQRIIRREPYATSLGPSHRRVFTNINWWIKRHQYAHIRPIHASNLATLQGIKSATKKKKKMLSSI